MRERGAIVAYLTDAYPAMKLGPLPGETGRGAYLSWLSYYQGIMEPLLILHWTGLDHPAITASLRDLDTMAATLAKPLGSGPWLLGDRFSAADMLCGAARAGAAECCSCAAVSPSSSRGRWRELRCGRERRR